MNAGTASQSSRASRISRRIVISAPRVGAAGPGVTRFELGSERAEPSAELLEVGRRGIAVGHVGIEAVGRRGKVGREAPRPSGHVRQLVTEASEWLGAEDADLRCGAHAVHRAGELDQAGSIRLSRTVRSP